MKLLPITKNIIFKFVDKVNAKGEFEKGQTESGILLQSSFDDSAKSPRWVDVVAVGPDCTLVQPGFQALLPNLRWTPNFKVDGEMMWRTDETEVVAVRAAPQAQVIPLKNVVLFKRHEKVAFKSTGLIVVMGGNTDTPSGTVIDAGPDAASELVAGSTIYFDDTNFTDTFVHGGVTMSFIKDDSILAYSGE